MNLKAKLRSTRGESLTETLCAVLVVSFASLMLATMLSVAVRINRKANDNSALFYEELTAAETGDALLPGTVRVTGDGISATVAVTVSGKADGTLRAYREETP